MSYLVFITITGSLGFFGAIFFAIRNNWLPGRILLPILSVLFPLAAYSEFFGSFNQDLHLKTILLRLALFFHFIISVSLLELTTNFLGKDGISTPFTFGKRQIRLRFIWRPVIVICAIATLFVPWFSYHITDFEVIVLLTSVGEILFSILFIYYLLVLYIIEKLFRNTTTIQKRIFITFFASISSIALGSMVLLVRILFYKTVVFETIQIHAALCAIFFPGIMIGLIRYRLWQEQIVIGRGMVYTSITILFFGLFLVALGLIAFSVQMLGLNFTEFEEFVLLFSFLFIGILAIFSPHMRKTITALSRKYIYKSKYDYRDQLLRLHTAHQTTGNVIETISAFIDNLQYTIIVNKACVFLRSTNENSFQLMTKPSDSVKEKLSFRANSALIRLFENDTVSAIEIDHPIDEIISTAINSERNIIEHLSLSHLFAIKYGNMLIGILGIYSGRRVFDTEDLMLITMFCESVGTAIFRDRIQKERIEQKQFESFSHMASFIIHDIKNQIATLTLVTRNAHDNISNPDFHPVLLRSLENSTSNLNQLIDKLQSPPQKEMLLNDAIDCNHCVAAVVENSAGALPAGITITTHLSSSLPLVNADMTALSYVIKNLIINAIEALGNTGSITCSTGQLSSIEHDDTYHFALTVVDRENKNVYIVVEDNGPGMSRQFMENRLFKPFNTTKDKGIGIGLYQCKTLVETMGGKLLCWSELGKGTRFCILL